MASKHTAQTLVRLYSLEVDERLPPGQRSHELGQVLAQDRNDSLQRLTQPWRCFYEPSSPFDSQRDTITQTVAIEANKLREKWNIFHGSCSPEDQLDLEAFEPTIEGAVAAIGHAMSTWNKKRHTGWRGKTASHFHKACGTLESHSNALSMLPQSSQYVSIFTGALTTIVQASVNHEKIVEDLSQAIQEIGEHVRSCTSEFELFPTEQMLGRVSDLYAHIFLFFSSVMDWIMQKRRKRMLDSFNQTFMERFQRDIDTIKAQAEMVRHIAAQASRVEVRVSRLTMEDSRNELRALRTDIRVGLEEIARNRAEMVYRDRLREMEVAEAVRYRDQVDQRNQILLSWLSEIMERGEQPIRNTTKLVHHSSVPYSVTSTQKEATNWIADSIMADSRAYEDFFHRDRVRLRVNDMTLTTVPREVLQRLTEWSGNSSSSLLWIAGEYSATEDWKNPVTLIAVQLILLLEKAQLPVVSYFCELRRGEPLRPDNTTREQQGVLALGYSLVRQMIELLLPQFTTDADFSASRLGRLDGTVTSCDDLLGLISDLAPLMPNTVYVVIDGLHWVDDQSANSMTRKLISCLRVWKEKLRVLFTTSGRSGVLLEQLERRESMVVDDDMLHGYGFVLAHSLSLLERAD